MLPGMLPEMLPTEIIVMEPHDDEDPIPLPANLIQPANSISQVGAGVSWNNLDNGKVLSGGYATTVSNVWEPGNPPKPLALGFDLSTLPDNAVITNIRVKYLHWCTQDEWQNPYGNAIIKLTAGGVVGTAIVSPVYSHTQTFVLTEVAEGGDINAYWANEGDLAYWGLNGVSVADIKSSLLFNFSISGNDENLFNLIRFDGAEIIITYTA